MIDIALNVLPVFVLIAIGWASVAVRLLKAEIGDALGDFVFKIGVPILLFRTVATADFQGGSPWGLWAAYFGGVVVTWSISHLLATRIFGRDERSGVVAGVSAGFANTVFIGLPLVQRFLGDDGLVAITILLSVHLPVMMLAGTLLMERAGRKDTGREPRGLKVVLGQVARTLLKNPLIIGLLAGSVARIIELPLTGLPRVVIDQLASTAAPVALFSIGMALNRYGIGGNVKLAAATTMLKLLLLPACVFVFGRLLGLPPTWAAALVLTAAVPTGVNAYLIANHFGIGHGLASSTITLTTIAGALTVTVWAAILGV